MMFLKAGTPSNSGAWKQIREIFTSALGRIVLEGK
jgi:hypothetical protein